MKLLEPRALNYKYDLMHFNTPSYASTVITWDTSKMGAITKKRVLEALATGKIKYNRGDAAQMYSQLRKHFQLPKYSVEQATPRKDGRTAGGYLRWENATPDLLHAINQVYKTERTIQRMESQHLPWYLHGEEKTDATGYFYFDTPHDLTEVNAEIAKILSSPELAARQQEAIDFVIAGGQLTFTWSSR